MFIKVMWLERMTQPALVTINQIQPIYVTLSVPEVIYRQSEKA